MCVVNVTLRNTVSLCKQHTQQQTDRADSPVTWHRWRLRAVRFAPTVWYRLWRLTCSWFSSGNSCYWTLNAQLRVSPHCSWELPYCSSNVVWRLVMFWRVLSSQRRRWLARDQWEQRLLQCCSQWGSCQEEFVVVYLEHWISHSVGE